MLLAHPAGDREVSSGLGTWMSLLTLIGEAERRYRNTCRAQRREGGRTTGKYIYADEGVKAGARAMAGDLVLPFQVQDTQDINLSSITS